MIKVTTYSIIGALAVWFTGCARTPVAEETTPFEDIQAKADTVVASGGFAVVGIGSAMTLPTARHKAIMRARRDMQHMVTDSVEGLKTQFSEEVRNVNADDLDAFFQTTIEELERQYVRALQPTRIHQDTHNGLITVWVLLVLDPAAIRDTLNLQASETSRPLLTRLKASRGYRDLEQQIERYQRHQP